MSIYNRSVHCYCFWNSTISTFNERYPKNSFIKNTNHLVLTDRSQEFKERIIEYLSKEGKQIPDQQSLLGTSDLIESILGKYKFFSSERPFKEMGQILLTIPLFTTEISCNLVKDAMESTCTKDLQEWTQKVFGQSMRIFRRAISTQKNATPKGGTTNQGQKKSPPLTDSITTLVEENLICKNKPLEFEPQKNLSDRFGQVI